MVRRREAMPGFDPEKWKRFLEELGAEADLKAPRPKTREMRGQRWGTLATMTAVEVSPAYQFR